jgi:RecA-family ATPase
MGAFTGDPDAKLRAAGVVFTQATPQRGRRFGRLQLLSDADALTAPPREYLLDGILGCGEFSLWWGAPKAKKSFAMLHIARAIAQGRSVFDREVQQCPVVYVAAEGGTGLPKRILALQRRHGPAPGFYYIAQRIDLHDPKANLSALIEAAQTIGAGLIVLDTKHRVTPGADENSSRDGGIFSSHVDLIREETGAHVAVIHHAGRNGEHPRGSNSLDAAIDTNIRLSAQGDTVTAIIEEAKDDPDGLGPVRQRVWVCPVVSGWRA